MAGSEGVFREKLNELIQYELVCVGYKGDKLFFYSQGKVSPGEYSRVRLREVSADELDRELGRYGHATEVREEQVFVQGERKDLQRRQANDRLRDLTEQAMRAFFPCSAEPR